MANMTLTIDDKEVTTPSGTSILMAARQIGIRIPTLCYHPRLSVTGACRVCVVEIWGRPVLVASCSAVAEDGMRVYTASERVLKARRLVVQLLLAGGNHNCLTCQANGTCELQALAYELGIEDLEFAPRSSGYPKDTSNAMIERDPDKCILCGRCVRACNDVQVNEVIEFGYRARRAKIVTAWDLPYGKSDCVFCGECVSVCPTGALTERQAKFQGRPWEVKKVRSTCVYCGTGCQLDLNVMDGRIVKVTSNHLHGLPNYGSLCVKGRFGYDFVHHKDRLTKPLIREGDRFRKAGWDEALNLVATRFSEIKNARGPDALAALSSARCTNEENYLLQKLMRAVIGTNNIDHCARLCHASTVTGLAAAFGSGAMTNTIADIEHARAILVTGSNTTEMHPIIASHIKRAVRQKGAKLIVVDPRRIDLVFYAHQWLRPKPGTDVAWINGLIHVILRDRLHDASFIQGRTEGFEALRSAVEPYRPEYVEHITGIAANQIEDAAHMYASASCAGIIYAMGITQHTRGTDNVKSLANLALACGNVGIPGAGVNPLRGQNNVQGACDMGALPNVFSGYQTISDETLRAQMAKAWGIGGLPSQPGKTLMEMMDQALTGNIGGLYIMGENPMLSDPDLHHVRASLRSLSFLVVQDIFLTETAALAHVVLPGASAVEKDGTFTNTERRVQRIRKAIEPIGDSRPDWQIICDLATHLGYPMSYENPEKIMEEIASVTPSYGGISYKRIAGRGIQWPCPSSGHPGTPYLHKDRFACGKARFHPVTYQDPPEVPDAKYPLYLSTGRILYHWHTGTMTRRVSGLVERVPECYVEIAPADARQYGIQEGDNIRIESRRGKIKAKAHITEKAVQGTIFAPFHFAEAAVNQLTHRATDPMAKIPGLKVCAVKLEKVAP
jgi:formate dehydrogenase (NADP+) alpha subunit